MKFIVTTIRVRTITTTRQRDLVAVTSDIVNEVIMCWIRKLDYQAMLLRMPVNHVSRGRDEHVKDDAGVVEVA